MRKRIDAHIHLRPTGIAGTHDERFNVSYEKYGALTIMGDWKLQGMPEFCVDSEFSAETAVHQMDCFNIEKSIIMASASSNIEVSIEAIQKYPERLVGAMVIPYDKTAVEYVERFYEMGFRVIKFETSTVLGYTHPTMYPDFKFNSHFLKKVYSICAEKKIAITIDPGVPFSKGYQVEELDEVINEYPETHFVIAHLGVPPYPYVAGNKTDIRWRQMLSLGKYENVWFDISAMPNLFKEEEYPYPTAIRLIKECVNQYGDDKIIWGTDIPSTYVNCTFRQMINLFEKCPLFSEEQKDLLFYINAKNAYNL